MKFKLLLILLFSFFLFNGTVLKAQTGGSTLTARQIDSANAARQKALQESAAMRKYRSSKHYKDSVEHARKARTKALTAAREARTDSMKAARMKVTDSLAAIRKVRTDSVKVVQNKRAERALKLKKYKESRRYADSVSIVKRERTDSLKQAQKLVRDSASRARKREMDISKGIRKHSMDSLKLVRKKYTDSVQAGRKKRMDALAKAKADKDKKLKSKDKVSEEKKKLAFEAMIKKKHEKFTNQTMLKRKWSPVRRFTQNSFTHYNYYYNANRKMEEANANMLRGGIKENLDSMIRLYPFDPDRDSSLLKGDMDTIIRKVSVGIQIHDPRVKWSNDLFLLMGQAYYYKGSYDNAATTFRYIISADEETKRAERNKKSAGKEGPSIVEEESSSKLDFLKHKSVHNDAILWLARTYVQQKQVENGQAVLSLLSSDPHLPEDMVGQVAAGKAFSYLSDRNEKAASEQLAIVVEDEYSPDWLRMRAAFLNGQLLQYAGKYQEASDYFERCLDFFPKLDMDFYARKNMAFNTLAAGKDVEEGMKPLKKVLNDTKYVTYYDQVYFVLGNLATKANKPDDAVKYLRLSATTPKATKKQKAQSYASLGDVYYSQGNYQAAKNSYDSSAKYAGSNSKDNNVLAAIQKAKGLNEISQPAGVIHDQDSLLELSQLSRKEQESAVRRYIRALEKKIQDSIENIDNEGVAAVTAGETTSDPTVGDAANWYFSNPTVMQQGAADFKKKWGNRPLTDNWRRSAALAFNNSGNGSEDSGVPEETPTNTNGLPSEEGLLAKIPNTKEQKAFAYKIEQRAYIMLAKAYVRQLDDFAKAEAALDTLDARYPDHNQKEEELYIRYQCAIRQNKLDKAQAYSAELLTKYPTSQYAAILAPKKEESKAASVNGGKSVSNYYDEAYDMILQHKYTEALLMVNNGQKTYDDPTYKKRFDIAEAMCYAGQANYTMADSLITKFIAANPGPDSLTTWASDIKAFIVDVKKNGVPTWYKESLAEEAYRKAHPNEPVAAKKADIKKPEAPKPEIKRPADVPQIFAYTPSEEHFEVILLGSLDSRVGPLKQKLKAVDSTHGMADAPILIDLYSTNQIMVLVKNLPNLDSAQKYLDTMNALQVFKDYKPNEIKTFFVSAKNYKKLFYDKDIDNYMAFYNQNYKRR